jgi:glycosyl transferase family 22 (putative mannosyltransferase)
MRHASALTPAEVRRYLVASLVLVMVTSYFSVTFFHPDEHYQVIELVGLKLGRTTETNLPWEFHERMRAWLQPAAYTAIARAAETIGIRDPFAWAWLWRLASGLLAWAAIRSMVRTSLGWCDGRASAIVQIRALALLGFVPYLAVRTSSENVSCSLLTIGFCFVMDGLDAGGRPAGGPDRGNRSALSAPVAFAGGALFGLAFECRFQTAVLVAGLIAWLVVFRRLRPIGALSLAAGVTAALAVGLLVDRWGYGEWTLPAVHYFRRNVVDRIASRDFGVTPVYGYLYLLSSNVFGPVVLVLMAGLTLTWLRHPKHPLTWATLPYVVVHCALDHKEERFFFPILLLATAGVTLGFSPARRTSPLAPLGSRVARIADRVAARLWNLRGGWLARIVVADNLFGLLLLAVYPLGWRSNLTFYAYVDRHLQPDSRILKLDDWDFPEYPFYRNGRWRVDTLARTEDGHASILETARREPTYFVTPLPYDGVPTGADVTAELVYSDFPGWQWSMIRDRVGPLLRHARRILDPIEIIPRAKWLTLYRLESGSPLPIVLPERLASDGAVALSDSRAATPPSIAKIPDPPWLGWRAGEIKCSIEGTTNKALARHATSPLIATQPND